MECIYIYIYSFTEISATGWSNYFDFCGQLLGWVNAEINRALALKTGLSRYVDTRGEVASDYFNPNLGFLSNF